MKLFGKQLAKRNHARIAAIFVLGIIWRIIIWDAIETKTRDPYLFPIIGFFLLAVILGELLRRLFRIIFKYKLIDHIRPITPEERERLLEEKKDEETLNIGIGLGIIWVILALVL